VSDAFTGENCGICYRANLMVPATHKVGEELSQHYPPIHERHNLTQYVCCTHFTVLMGEFARTWCDQFCRGPHV